MINYTTKIFYILSLLSLTSISSQNLPGCRHASLSYSDIGANSSVFSLFSNPAGLALRKNREIGFYYSPSPYGIDELSNAYFGYKEATHLGNFSLGVKHYGFKLYKENDFALSYAINISEKIYSGITFYNTFISIERYGSVSLFNFSIGSIFNISEEGYIGFSLSNLLRNNSVVLDSPTIYSFGITYLPISKASLNFSLVKELKFPFSYRFGVEYELIEFIYLRTGMQTEPDRYSGGIGIFYKFINLNYSINTHFALGFTHQFDLILNFD